MPSSSAVITEQLRFQLKQHQAKHEQAQASLQAQLNEAMRERNEMERLPEQRQILSSHLQDPQQSSSSTHRERSRHQSSTSSAASRSSQFGGPINDLALLADTANPFLPPQVVQRIIGSSTPTRGGTPFSPDGGELGRATLLQMNELSRRVAHQNAGERNTIYWDNAIPDGSGPDQQQGQRRATQSDQEEKLGNTEDLADMRNSRITQGGWLNLSLGVDANSDPGPSAPDEVMRNVDKDSGRVGFNVSMARDDTFTGIGTQRSESQELQDNNGRQSQKRKSECIAFHTNARASPEGVSTVEPSANYTQSFQNNQMPNPASPVQAQAQPTSSPQVLGQSRKRNDSFNLWASLMSGQSFIDVLGAPSEDVVKGALSGGESSSGGSASFGAIEEDGSLAHEGLQVYTVGHLLPKGVGMSGSEDLRGWWGLNSESGRESGIVHDSPGIADKQQQQQVSSDGTSGTQIATLVNEEDEENEVVQPTPSQSLVSRSTTAMSSSFDSPGSQKLRVRRSTYVPGWAVPPRVLLVDDDAVSRKLSSKFLKVFGCTIDVAVDGIGAVNKMNLEKYDLVLMDIVMPKLDGVSATSLIRKFDQGTPIISMTSNSKPNEIMTYYSSGMNDILSKPFSKEGLLEMLEVRIFRHCFQNLIHVILETPHASQSDATNV